MLEQLFRFGAGQAIQNQINIGSGADASSVLFTPTADPRVRDADEGAARTGQSNVKAEAIVVTPEHVRQFLALDSVTPDSGSPWSDTVCALLQARRHKTGCSRPQERGLAQTAPTLVVNYKPPVGCQPQTPPQLLAEVLHGRLHLPDGLPAATQPQRHTHSTRTRAWHTPQSSLRG